MSVLFDWKINDIENKIRTLEHKNYEIHQVVSDVGSLERAVRELVFKLDGVCSELQEAEYKILILERRLDEASL